ncbi:hypothetical protein F4808DRAFT_465263 [Astrocystis sublimbata]|nr:hypothetical protein F4808DRAFT_465263 [Astrocystis sublimbata]
MEPHPYQKFMSSGHITILVGPDKNKYTIHAELLASLSCYLYTLVKGAATKSPVVEWPHIDDRTFACFSQFAYSRRYHIANPTPPKVEESPGGSSRPRTPSPDEANTSGSGSDLAPRPIGGIIAPQTFTDLTIAHAKVYVFADYLLIKDLKKLSISFLEDILKFAWFKGETIAELGEYIYNNTKKNKKQNSLRKVVSLYISRYLDRLCHEESGVELLETNVELCKDVLWHTLPRGG